MRCTRCKRDTTEFLLCEECRDLDRAILNFKENHQKDYPDEEELTNLALEYATREGFMDHIPKK